MGAAPLASASSARTASWCSRRASQNPQAATATGAEADGPIHPKPRCGFLAFLGVGQDEELAAVEVSRRLEQGAGFAHLRLGVLQTMASPDELRDVEALLDDEVLVQLPTSGILSRAHLGRFGPRDAHRCQLLCITAATGVVRRLERGHIPQFPGVVAREPGLCPHLVTPMSRRPLSAAPVSR